MISVQPEPLVPSNISRGEGGRLSDIFEIIFFFGRDRMKELP